MLAALPDWLDSDRLQWILLGVLVGLVFVALAVVRFVQRLVMRIVVLVVVAAFGASLWLQREALADCGPPTCECRLYGQDVHVPACDRFGGTGG